MNRDKLQLYKYCMKLGQGIQTKFWKKIMYMLKASLKHMAQNQIKN